eukprot:TRINITY_DN7676_c0_g1_i2.p1 TRINITY_DN7676_c0_g1~~TRINITY_DN7676_c0_g1_i2.p1  ORF type:complete len:451 (+),score=72.78 TRINITY_DN7676_c0_g1_i2:23-1375(+)
MEGDTVHIFIKDFNGYIIDINDTAAKSLGYPREYIRGKHSSVFYQYWEKYLLDDRRIKGLGKPLLGIIEPYKDDIPTVMTDKIPLRDENGEIYAVAACATDIRGYVNQGETALQEFINYHKLTLAKLNHELRGPLSGLPLLISHLESLCGSSKEHQQTLQYATQSAKLTLEMTNQVLDSYFPDTFQNMGVFDLNWIIHDVLKMGVPTATDKLTTIRYEPVSNLMFKGDHVKVKSIISSIILELLKISHENSDLLIGVVPEGNNNIRFCIKHMPCIPLDDTLITQSTRQEILSMNGSIDLKHDEDSCEVSYCLHFERIENQLKTSKNIRGQVQDMLQQNTESPEKYMTYLVSISEKLCKTIQDMDIKFANVNYDEMIPIDIAVLIIDLDHFNIDEMASYDLPCSKIGVTQEYQIDRKIRNTLIEEHGFLTVLSTEYHTKKEFQNILKEVCK